MAGQAGRAVGRRSRHLGVFAVIALALVPASAIAAPEDTLLVSRSSGLGPPDGTGQSFGSSISADGRFVAFSSVASNLVEGDANRHYDVFVRDVQTAGTRIVSRSSGTGAPDANGISGESSVSADGRFVAFASSASNLVAGDANSWRDIFVRDLETSTTRLVSRSSGVGAADGNGASFQPSISADGRFVAFTSFASSLVDGDTNGEIDVFVRDLKTDTTRTVSRSNGVGAPDGYDASQTPSISADGRFVAFASGAFNLVGDDDVNTHSDVFVRDLQTNTTRLASRSSGAGASNGNGDSYQPSISGDGRLVAFASSAGNLVGGDRNRTNDVFVRDLQTDTTRIVSRSSGAGEPDGDFCVTQRGPFSSEGPSMSADGRFVAFYSCASNLAGRDRNETFDVFVRDLATSTTSLVSRSSGAGAVDGKGASVQPSTSGDGRFVAFSSDADNFVAADENDASDVFRRELDVAPLPQGAGPGAVPPGDGGPLPPGVPPGGGGPARDLVKPVASALKVSPVAFATARSGAAIVAARTGTRVAYRLSEAARVRFSVQRRASGRRVGGRCVAVGRSNRRRPSCARYRAVRGFFLHAGREGQNSFRFSGRMGGRALKPGSYRLVGVPTDAAGNVGAAALRRFGLIASQQRQGRG